ARAAPIMTKVTRKARSSRPPSSRTHCRAISALPTTVSGFRWKLPHPGDDRFDHGSRLLGGQRVAGVRYHDDACAVAEFVPDFIRHRARLERVVRRLEIEQRNVAA